MKEFTYTLTVSVAPQDTDLAARLPDYVKGWLHGTAVTVISCEQVN